VPTELFPDPVGPITLSKTSVNAEVRAVTKELTLL
jgi:hypothetical protein